MISTLLKDHLNNTLKQKWIYKYLGWDEPEYIHYGLVSIPNTNLKTSKIRESIKNGEFNKIGWLSEIDSLELHALTMTGKNAKIVVTSKTLQIIEMVRNLRKKGIKAYFSMQTGPSVFINTQAESVKQIEDKIKELGFEYITSKIGGPTKII